MLNFVAESSPLPMLVGSVFNGRVGCPNVANAVNHARLPISHVGASILTLIHDFIVYFVPDNTDSMLTGGGAAGQHHEQKEIAHGGIIYHA